MTTVNLKSLVGKLNSTCHRALDAAAGTCLSRTHYNIEIEHWLLKLIETPNNDLAVLFRYYEVDTARLLRDITKAVDRFKTGNSKPPALSPDVVAWAREAYVIAGLEYGAGKVRSGYLLHALLADDQL